MTTRRFKGRRLEPIEAFEVTPWRALALFRLATLIYACALTVHNVQRYAHPSGAVAVSAAMAVWSGLSIVGYERSSLRAWPLLGTDIAVTAACVLASRPVVGAAGLAQGLPTLTIAWMACAVLSTAVIKGVGWGVGAAVAIGACDLGVRGVVTQATLTGTIIMIMAAAALGYLGNIATRAQEQLRELAARSAATGERERLARGIHDSVLQVLALVQRRGEAIGGEAAELGRLAGEQEAVLRSLVNSGNGVAGRAGMADLREAVGTLASAKVVVSAPATAVWLPSPVASELLGAVTAATKNVHQHCPPETNAWILLEEEGDAVTVTVRDDGPGIPAGRLDQAVAQGRLGVAQSIRGRIADLGGTVTIHSEPGRGTEVELILRRGAV